MAAPAAVGDGEGEPVAAELRAEVDEAADVVVVEAAAARSEVEVSCCGVGAAEVAAARAKRKRDEVILIVGMCCWWRVKLPMPCRVFFVRECQDVIC